MITFVSFDGKKNELIPIEKIIRDIAALVTEDKWNIYSYDKLTEFSEYIEDKPLVDMSCFDITQEGAFDKLVTFRREYEQMQLMLIADNSVSPLVYLKPGIRPDSLLLRPLSKEMVRSSFKEFIESYVERQNLVDNQKVFTIDTKDGKIAIPYNDIFYFEAREKKLFIRTLSEEYGFYETIENIEQNMPDGFGRCHRSFIVNKTKIRRIMLSQNYMELTEGFEVPLSRSYKPDFKHFGK